MSTRAQPATIYGVQAFRLSPRGRLLPDPVIPASSPQAALRTAACIAPAKAGVIAFARVETSGYSRADPVVLAEYGQLPPQMDALRREPPAP